MPSTHGTKINISFLTKPAYAVQHNAFMKLKTAKGNGISLEDFCSTERFIAVSGPKYIIEHRKTDA